MSKGTGLVKRRERAEKLIEVFPERAQFYLEMISVLEEEISRAGVCRLCGRPLTDPEAIKRGLGKECWARTEARE